MTRQVSPPASAAVPPGPSGCGEGGLSDADLELRIEAARLRLHTSPSPEIRRAAWDELCDLVNGRSPAQVARMEHERGLR